MDGRRPRRRARFAFREVYRVEGIVNQLPRRYEETESETNRERIEGYMAEQPCPDCKGARLRPDASDDTVVGRCMPKSPYLLTGPAGPQSLEVVDQEQAPLLEIAQGGHVSG